MDVRTKLVLSVEYDEQIEIGPITLSFKKRNGTRPKIIIEAPKMVDIHRRKIGAYNVTRRIQKN